MTVFIDGMAGTGPYASQSDECIPLPGCRIYPLNPGGFRNVNKKNVHMAALGFCVDLNCKLAHGHARERAERL